MNQLHLFSPASTSALPEVRDSAPLWPPESAESNATELERLVRLRGRTPTEADCPWCGQTAAVVYSRGSGDGSSLRYGALDDHLRPDGQRCRGTYEALADLRERA